ncbi:hypothetical protein ATANTOWER_002429 [Ataeniobius toweri]|uniref:Uncharacterized protein n=1 Tax=Ataeniobius toweri TaxID=208326 RepID=A0ABU7C5S6_9TELE|nr:hypothetical protein [Ataeniobius toweri]
MIQGASDRPPPWARSLTYETEQMLALSANHRFDLLNRKPTASARWLPPPLDLLPALIFSPSANQPSWVDDIMG